MTLTLHHLEKSRSHRILWLLEELELDYEMQMYKRNKAFRAPRELRQVHPLGKAPIVTDDDIVVAETGAVIEYILDTRADGRLRPELGTEADRRFRYFLHYAEGSLMPPLLVALIFHRLKGAKVPFFVKPVVKKIAGQIDSNYLSDELELHTVFLNDALSQRDWFAGDEFTAADIQMSYPVQALLQRGAEGHDTSRLQDFVARIESRPAYKRALDKGGRVM